MGGPGSGNRACAKFTAKLGAELVKLVRKGNYVETAAAACGVSAVAVRNWMREGRRSKSGAKHDFSCAMLKAEAKAEADAVGAVRFHGQKTWQALAWYLERRHPKRWGKRDVKIEPAGKSKDGEPVFKFVLGDGD